MPKGGAPINRRNIHAERKKERWGLLQKQSQRQFLFSLMVHVKETQAHVEQEHVYFP